MSNTDGSIRENIEIGYYVEIVQKHHQRSGELTDVNNVHIFDI